MRYVNSRFLIGKSSMYTMPPVVPLSKKRWLAPATAFALLLLVFFAGVDTSAQRRKRPATGSKQQQGAGANANTQTAQAKPQKKNITPLRSGDTSDGSRITITSDAPLNDYSAYRSGDRYYVVIPEANAPRAQSGLRGRGFEDVQVQKRGNDAILSFKLQPGTNARVSQRFNRLDVELTAPGGRTASVPTATPKPATPPTVTPTPQTATRPTPQTASSGQNSSTTGNTGQATIQPTNPAVNNPVLNQFPTGGNPPVVSAPTPDASASPGINPEASPVASPPAEQIAQVQEPPLSQPATTSAPATASGTTLGAALRQNWLVILIAALVLLSLVMIVAARSRAQQSAAATPARRTSLKEKREARKASAALAEADTSSVVAAPVYKTATLPKARPTKTAAAIAAVVAAEAVVDEAVTDKAKAASVAEDEATKEVEVAPAVDVERVETEVGNVLSGESYDASIIGTSDAGTRQLVATGLLSALAARNVTNRERAREAFIKHDYLDEATRILRTADAPAERAAAARSLGYVQDKSTTPHLIAALEDDVPEVRRAAVESLAELRDPAAVQPLKSLLKNERDRKVSRSLIKRAIEASRTVVQEEEPQTITAATPVLETETATLEAPPVIGQADVVSITETETQTLEAEAPAVEAEESPVALADISTAQAASELIVVAAPPLIIEEAEAEAKEAARREAEEETARQQAEEERLRVEAEAQRQAEEEARLAAEAKANEERRQEEEAARLRAEEEARAQAAEEERLRAEEEARQRAEAEAQRVAEEEARLKVEEEARQAAAAEAQRRAEEAARLQAQEEAARLRAEEEERQRVAAEESRQAEEVAARLKIEQEAARQRAEEKEEQRAEQERLRLEEEARQRAEAEAAQLRAEEESARQRAEEEQRQREAEEARRLAAEAQAEREAQARREAEEAERYVAEAEEQQRRFKEERERSLAAEETAAMLNAEAVSPIEIEGVAETKETVEIESSVVIPSVDPLIERNDGTPSEWIDVDISEPEIVRHSEPIALTPLDETATQPELLFAEPALQEAEPIVQESKEIEPSAFSIVEEHRARPVSKEIDYAVQEKGLAEFDEFSSVPGAILKRLGSESTEERASAVADLARVGSDDSFRQINAAFDDPAIEVRNAAARSLFGLNSDRAATFTRALRESPPERRRKIGAALASSGLASEAIGQLMGESREKTYDAFSLLFLMSKAGEVQPLMRAIEEHPNNEVRLAVVKLLALSGQQEILPAFRRLAVRGSLPTEVRSAVMEAIYQISSQSPTPA
jgi:HEAT repeat protein